MYVCVYICRNKRVNIFYYAVAAIVVAKMSKAVQQQQQRRELSRREKLCLINTNKKFLTALCIFHGRRSKTDGQTRQPPI